MDRRWRPIQDESALNSIAGSNVGGRGPAVNRQDRNLVLKIYVSILLRRDRIDRLGPF